MSEKEEEKKHIPVVTEDSLKFLETYINNASPTGYEIISSHLLMSTM
jgi:hypothetical protein